MSKIRRGGHSAEGETLSAGRVEYLEAARARVRTRRIRRTVIIVAVLTILVLFATGAVGSSIARAKDLVDTAVIALAPAAGWPQQTGITDPDAVAQMSGSFVEMGGDSCVVYSLGGTRLNSIQSGYARPAIAAGKTRFVLYNRSGNELRVESRTQNLYTKTMDSTISLCAVADAGQVAVVTDSTDSVAKLTVYNSSMQQQLVWNLTSEQGTPLRMAFAPDSRRLAVAAVSAVGGQLTTNLYVLPLSQGDPVCLGSENSVPQWMGWMSNGFLLVLYENRAVLYNTSGGSAGERASYDFGGGTLRSTSCTLARPIPWPLSFLVVPGSLPSSSSRSSCTRLRTEIRYSSGVLRMRTCTSGGRACAAARVALSRRLESTMTISMLSKGIRLRSHRSK